MKFIKTYKFTILGFMTALVLSTFFLVYVELRKLTPFEIYYFKQNTENNETLNVLKWSTSKNAVKYSVAVLNEDLKLLKVDTTTDNELNLGNLDIETNKNLIIDIIAYDKNGKQLQSTPMHYKTKWENPSINRENLKVPIVNNLDLPVKISYNERIDYSEYYVLLKKDGKDIYKKSIDKNETIIPSSDLEILYGEYELSLCRDVNDERVVIDNLKIDVILPDITEIIVTNPTDKNNIIWDDFNITFEGGEYATNYYMTLVDTYDNIIFENEEVFEKSREIDITTLEQERTYTLTVKATNYLNPTIEEISVTTFTTQKMRTAENVKSNVKDGEIKKGNAVELSSNTSDAEIYYTTDGSEPTIESKKYKGPITINKDVIIKSIAVRKNMHNSKASTFDYWVYDKSNSVYLSPSNQYKNIGVAKVGYTNEMEMMNKVADYIEETLNQRRIKVYRNNPNMTLEEIVNDSARKEVSMHIAVHSNASSSANSGKQNGVETWVYDESCTEAIKIAEAVQKSIMSIYYDKKADRGIKYSYTIGGFWETSPKAVTNGILTEIAFHDNEKDAKWIVDNIPKIGKNIGNAIAEYLGK